MRMMRHQQPTARHGVLMPPRVERVDCADTVGSVSFAEGMLTLQASADALMLRLEAADQENLRRLEDAVAARLHTIGRRDSVTVTWHRPDALPVLASDLADDVAPATGPGAGKRRWPGRLGWGGLVAVGVLIVALHVGLGGTAVATSAWTGWAGNIVLVIIVGKAVFIAAHVLTGRYAFRRGKAMHARWRQRQSRPDATSAGEAAAASPQHATQERP